MGKYFVARSPKESSRPLTGFRTQKPAQLSNSLASTSNLRNLTSDMVLSLQSTLGNAYVQRLVKQANKPSDMIQRRWDDTTLNYQTMKEEKTAGQFRTKSKTKKFGTSLRNAVDGFIRAVQEGKEKEVVNKLKKLREVLQDDSKRQINPTKGADTKKWNSGAAEEAAEAFFKKWIAAVSEHLEHVEQSDNWLKDFQAVYGIKQEKKKWGKKRAKKSGSFNITREILEDHVKAYHKSRFYHMTRPGNVVSIMETGLDPRYGGSDKGLSEAHSDKDTSEVYKQESKGVVHLGKDYYSIVGMEGTFRERYPDETPHYLRAFIGAKQRKRLIVDTRVDNGNYLNDISIAKAVKSEEGIPSEYIYEGSFDELTAHRQEAICSRIREFYPDPKPTVEQVVLIHLEALRQQLIYTDDPNPMRKPPLPRRYSQ